MQSNGNGVSDKDILYSMIRREVSNAFAGIPIFSAFDGTVSSWIIRFIDPYVTAFIGTDNKLDTEQLSAFASEEATNKINEFKNKYKTMKGNENISNEN